jgi:hypothetical protein
MLILAFTASVACSACICHIVKIPSLLVRGRLTERVISQMLEGLGKVITNKRRATSGILNFRLGHYLQRR